MVLELIGILIGAVAIIIGIGAILVPKFMSSQFGIPSEDQAGLAYVMSLGSRDLALGLIILSQVYFGQFVLMGYSCIFLGIVAVSDFIVVRKNGITQASYLHGLSAIALFIYGFYMILTGSQ